VNEEALAHWGAVVPKIYTKYRIMALLPLTSEVSKPVDRQLLGLY